MSFNAGIIGLPNVGKTTIFNALTAAGAEASLYPFCTIEPNIAVIPYHDKRLLELVDMVNPPQWAAATIKFMDVAGLVQGASKGEGLGNQFLGHIRTVDVLIHVVRCFENSRIAHVSGTLNPIDDIDIINTELLLADIEVLVKRSSKVNKLLRGGDKSLEDTMRLIDRLLMALNEDQPARSVPIFNDDERMILNEFDLLTARPVIYVANIGENEIHSDNKCIQSIGQKALDEDTEFVKLCGDIEAGLVDLELEEQEQFRAEYGLNVSSLDSLVAAVVRKLKLAVFYTIAGREVRSWLIPEGSPAPKAAGKIHSDMEQGFIKAEVISFDELMLHGGWSQAREQGAIRIEGKKYLIQDGDVVLFRFNV